MSRRRRTPAERRADMLDAMEVITGHVIEHHMILHTQRGVTGLVRELWSQPITVYLGVIR